MQLKSEILYLTILVSFIIACTNEQPSKESSFEKSFRLVDSVNFELPFSYLPDHSATYYDIETDKNLYYFADLTSRKKLILFSSKGDSLGEVNLKNGIDALNQNVQDLEVISIDTVMLISGYDNNLVFVNRNGEVWKKFETNQELDLNKDSTQQYELVSSLDNTSSLINRKDYVIFVSTPRNPNNFSNPYNWALANKVNNWKKPHFMRINDIFSDSVNYSFGGKIMQRISPQDSNAYIIDIFNHYLVREEAVYATNLFSNKIFILDPVSMNVKNEVEVKSNYTSLGIPVLFSSTMEENDSVSEEVSKHLKERGKISGVWYNEVKEHFYVLASIDKEIEKNKELALMNKSVLIIFDKDFKKLNEVLIDNKKYFGPLTLTDNGFMLRKANVKNENYNKQKLSMYEFAY